MEIVSAGLPVPRFCVFVTLPMHPCLDYQWYIGLLFTEFAFVDVTVCCRLCPIVGMAPGGCEP